MSQPQIDKISELLIEYSAGNYSFQGEISDAMDEFDMIISGINMLGEELLSTNVDKDYFSSIFNAVTDLVMILDVNGNLIDHNQAVEENLLITKDNSHEIKFDDLLCEGHQQFQTIKSTLDNDIKSVLIEADLIGLNDKVIHGQLTCSRIIDRFDEFKGYLISIKDITAQKLNEQLTLKAIFSAQQAEQKRVADDLHDSLGQELSMTKLMISNLRKHSTDNPKSLELISTCIDILNGSIKNLREICFNLMPGVLTRGGLNMAISELANKLNKQESFRVLFEKNPEIERMDSDLEIVLYRITQEFINNMIKHSDASELRIELNKDSKTNFISLYLEENGQGFDMSKLNKIGENRGYQNLKTKVKAFNGLVSMNSAPGEGTSTYVKFPIIAHHEEN